MHPAHLPGGAPHWSAPPGSTCLTGDLTAEEVAAHQEVRHQPRGVLGRPVWRPLDTLAAGLRHPRARWKPSTGFTGPGPRRAWTPWWRDYGLAMDLDDLRSARITSATGGPGPHHHRDPGDRHLLVRPLPPHHLPDHHLDDVEIARCQRSRQTYERYLATREERLRASAPSPSTLMDIGHHRRPST